MSLLSDPFVRKGTLRSKGFPQGFLLDFILTAKGAAAPPCAFEEEFHY